MSNHVRRADIGLGKTAAGGSSGSFAVYGRQAAAPPPVAVAVPVPPEVGDDVTLVELDAAVNFLERDAAIRRLWDQGAGYTREAEEQSAKLVRDSIAWRYPEASTVVVTEYDGQNLALAELWDRHGKPIAASPVMGQIEYGEVDYGNVPGLDATLNDELGAHVGALPRTGKHAPKMIPPDKLRGVGNGSTDNYRFRLRPQGPSAVERAQALKPSAADKQRAAEQVAHELMSESHPNVKGMTHPEASEFVKAGASVSVSAATLKQMYAGSVERYHQIGADHPLDNRIESDWANRVYRADGKAKNIWSKLAQDQAIDEALKMRRLLTEGKIQARKIIGTGYENPKAEAFAHLQRQVEFAERAIETRGRSLAGERFTERELKQAYSEAEAELREG